MKILILGVSGMIGQAMFQSLAEISNWHVMGSVRSKEFCGVAHGPVISGVDLTNTDQISDLLYQTSPDVIINCAGLTKHLQEGREPVPALTMNSLLPHRLAKLCAITGSRLIHISTDCVFDGKTGGYVETDITDAIDVYGRTKALGEVTKGNVLTLRTSTIGHEDGVNLGLLEWFLRQSSCKGYSRAFFSGLPTFEFARVVRDFVIPASQLNGLYHVGGAVIDKYSLLNLINEVYKAGARIERDESFSIDRSLNSDKFNAATGYIAPTWPEMIEAMWELKRSKG